MAGGARRALSASILGLSVGDLARLGAAIAAEKADLAEARRGREDQTKGDGGHVGEAVDENVREVRAAVKSPFGIQQVRRSGGASVGGGLGNRYSESSGDTTSEEDLSMALLDPVEAQRLRREAGHALDAVLVAAAGGSRVWDDLRLADPLLVQAAGEGYGYGSAWDWTGISPKIGDSAAMADTFGSNGLGVGVSSLLFPGQLAQDALQPLGADAELRLLDACVWWRDAAAEARGAGSLLKGAGRGGGTAAKAG